MSKRGLLFFIGFFLLFCFVSVSAIPDGWGNAIQLTVNESSKGLPRAVVDSNNDIHIVWHDSLFGTTELFYTKINENGTTLIQPKLITEYDGSTSYDPDIAIDGNGTLHVAWLDYRPSQMYSDLYYKQLDSTGNTTLNDTLLRDGLYSVTDGRINVDSKDNIHIFLTHQDDITPPPNGWMEYIKSFNNGTIQTTGGGTCGFPDKEFDIDSEDNLHIGYARRYFCSSPNYYVFYEKRDEDGSGLVGETFISNGMGGGPDLVLDSETSNHIVWIDYDSDLAYSKLDFNGSTLIDDTKLVTGYNNDVFYSQSITIDSNDRLHSVFINNSAGPERINYVEFDKNGNILVPNTVLTPEYSIARNPFVLLDSNDKIHLLWVDYSHLYYKKKVGAPLITDLIPIQVVEDVPMVKGKRTLVRAVVESSKTGGDTVNVKVFYNGTEINDTNIPISGPGVSVNVDTFHIPLEALDNVEYLVEAESLDNGFRSPNKTKMVNVTETRDLNVYFTAVGDIAAQDYFETVGNNIQFIEDTYPLIEDNLITNGEDTYDPIAVNPQDSLKDIENKIKSKLYLSQHSVTGAIGIVPFTSNLFSDAGVKIGTVGSAGVILVRDAQVSTSAHEVAHILGFCEEYSSSSWLIQNLQLFVKGLGECRNGDKNDDGFLDNDCESNDGCPTNTLMPLYVNYNNGSLTEETKLRNFMGGGDVIGAFETWISKDSYNALLDIFNINSTVNIPRLLNQSTANCKIVRSFYYKNGTIENLANYELNDCHVDNANLSNGNFSVLIQDNVGVVISNISFNPDFTVTGQGGNITETNVSFVIFSLMTNSDAAKIVFRDATQIISQINKSLHIPMVNINTNLQDTTLTGIKNITWEANDNDNDTLSYAIVLNSESDINKTLEFDLTNNNFAFNSSSFTEGNYNLEILATDGFNTNSSNSGQFCIDSDLSVCGLKLLNKTANVAIFEFIVSNALSQDLSNINWAMYTGDGISINSTIAFNLTSQEDILNYVEYQYASSGNYGIIVTANAANLSDTQSINITI